MCLSFASVLQRGTLQRVRVDVKVLHKAAGKLMLLCAMVVAGKWVHVKETTVINEGKLFSPGNLRATFDNPEYEKVTAKSLKPYQFLQVSNVQTNLWGGIQYFRHGL